MRYFQKTLLVLCSLVCINSQTCAEENDQGILERSSGKILDRVKTSIRKLKGKKESTPPTRPTDAPPLKRGSKKVSVNYNGTESMIYWTGTCLEKLTDDMIRGLFTQSTTGTIEINDQDYNFSQYSHFIAKDKWEKFTKENPQSKCVAVLAKDISDIGTCIYKITDESDPKKTPPIVYELLVRFRSVK